MTKLKLLLLALRPFGLTPTSAVMTRERAAGENNFKEEHFEKILTDRIGVNREDWANWVVFVQKADVTSVVEAPTESPEPVEAPKPVQAPIDAYADDLDILQSRHNAEWEKAKKEEEAARLNAKQAPGYTWHPSTCAFFAVVYLPSESPSQHDSSNVENLANRVWKFALSNVDGCSYRNFLLDEPEREKVQPTYDENPAEATVLLRPGKNHPQKNEDKWVDEKTKENGGTEPGGKYLVVEMPWKKYKGGDYDGYYQGSRYYWQEEKLSINNAAKLSDGRFRFSAKEMPNSDGGFIQTGGMLRRDFP